MRSELLMAVGEEPARLLLGGASGSCSESRLVVFACKGRGFCPACMGRRMADSAVCLEQRVLPVVPVRHWIMS